MSEKPPAIEPTDEKNGDTRGVGIFSGPPSEKAQLWGCLGPLIIGVIGLFIAGIALAANADSSWKFIPAAGCVLLALYLIHVSIGVARTPMQPTRQIAVDGVWLTKEGVLLGKQDVELQRAEFIADVYSRESTGINAVRPNLTDTGRLILNVKDASIVLQIVNSKYNANDYRIARIHINGSGSAVRTYNLMVTGNPILITSGSINNCKMMSLVDQLRRIVAGFELIKETEMSTFSLSITPRGGVGGAWIMYGAIGGLVKGISDSLRTNSAKESLVKGEFIDKQTGEFLLEMMEKYQWKVEIRPLQVNELGLAGSEW